MCAGNGASGSDSNGYGGGVEYPISPKTAAGLFSKSVVNKAVLASHQNRQKKRAMREQQKESGK